MNRCTGNAHPLVLYVLYPVTRCVSGGCSSEVIVVRRSRITRQEISRQSIRDLVFVGDSAPAVGEATV